VEVYLTTGGGDAKRRAGCLEADVDRLVVAGGDGTLNEVLNGPCDPSRTPIALLPMGTANVLARELGLPREPVEIAAMIDGGAIRRLDMGLVGERRFLMVV